VQKETNWTGQQALKKGDGQAPDGLASQRQEPKGQTISFHLIYHLYILIENRSKVSL